MYHIHPVKGFSFVEMIIVVSLFSLLSIGLLSTIVLLYRANAHALAQSYEVNHARHGMESSLRDIREMAFADNGAYPLVEMSSTTIGFYSDVDRDNSVEYIRYTLSTTTLYRYVYNATGTPPTYPLTTPTETDIISEYVQNIVQATSTFRYFLDNGVPATATSTVTDVRYILLNLVINVDPNRDPGEYTLHSSVAPRNLKINF